MPESEEAPKLMEIKPEELENIPFVLDGKPNKSNFLSVFVQNPQNSEQFLYKRLRIKTDKMGEFVSAKEIKTDYDFLEPVGREKIKEVIEMQRRTESNPLMIRNEENLFFQTVGIVSYKNPEGLSLDKMIQLAGFLYIKERK